MIGTFPYYTMKVFLVGCYYWLRARSEEGLYLMVILFRKESVWERA
jgi:hypothetical protein